MATLKIKSDLILLLRKLKNPWIWILFFRVAKIWQSGLPYLWRIWRYNFKIDVRWWAKHQLKWPCIQILWGNFSRIVPTARPPVLCTGTGPCALLRFVNFEKGSAVGEASPLKWDRSPIKPVHWRENGILFFSPDNLAPTLTMRRQTRILPFGLGTSWLSNS